MSLTIITASGSNFWTNISGEHLIGKLCEMSGAKCSEHKWSDDWVSLTMAYEMTSSDVLETSNKLKTLLPKVNEIFPELSHFFAEGATPTDLYKFIVSTTKQFEDSRGYHCC